MSRPNPANLPAHVIASLPGAYQTQVALYYETLQPNIWAASTVCLVAACVATSLRIYSRRLKCQSLAWDDYLVFAAMGFYIPFYVAVALSVAWGTGRHEIVAAVEHPEYIQLSSKAFFAAEILSTFPLYLTKMSTLFLYNRIFGGASDTFTRTIITIGVWLTATHISFIFLSIFACVPIAANWESVSGGHCIQTRVAYVVFSALFTISDVMVLLMPMPFIWRICMSWTRKLQLTGIFFLGSIVVVVALTRTCMTGTLSQNHSDASWANSVVLLLQVTQSGVAVVATCLPVLRAVFNKVLYGSSEGPATRCETQHRFCGIDSMQRTPRGANQVCVNGSVSSMGCTDTKTLRSDGSTGTEKARRQSLYPEMQDV